MATRITKKELFTDLRALAESADRPDLVTFIDHELDLLASRSTSKKPTAKQKENETIKATILEVLERAGRPMLCGELIADSALNTCSSQKMSALLSQLEVDKLVVRIVEKKKAFFTLPSEG